VCICNIIVPSASYMECGKVEGNSWFSIKVWFCIDMICMLGNEGKSRCVLYYLVLILIM